MPSSLPLYRLTLCPPRPPGKWDDIIWSRGSLCSAGHHTCPCERRLYHSSARTQYHHNWEVLLPVLVPLSSLWTSFKCRLSFLPLLLFPILFLSLSLPPFCSITPFSLSYFAAARIHLHCWLPWTTTNQARAGFIGTTERRWQPLRQAHTLFFTSQSQM